jgi:hypothetical protein
VLALALATLAAAGAPVDRDRLIDVRDSGEIVRVGAFRPKQYLGEREWPGGVAPTRANAIKAYGRPDRRDRAGCLNRWSRLRIRIVTADFGGGDACGPKAGVQRVEIRSRRWATERGLRVGHSLGRVRALYPELARYSDVYGDAPDFRRLWGLVFEPSQVGGSGTIDRLAATIRDGKVVALRVSPFGAGD